MGTIKLEELDIYRLAFEIGECTWNIVSPWEWFPKKTVGTQFVSAADSISANISEGYGRYFYKDRKQFCYIVVAHCWKQRIGLLRQRTALLLQQLSK